MNIKEKLNSINTTIKGTLSKLSISRKALASMGYSEGDNGQWFKPVGYHLFTYEETTRTWSNWFPGNGGSPIKWSQANLAAGRSLLAALKEWESHAQTTGSHQSFEISDEDFEHLFSGDKV